MAILRSSAPLSSMAEASKWLEGRHEGKGGEWSSLRCSWLLRSDFLKWFLLVALMVFDGFKGFG